MNLSHAVPCWFSSHTRTVLGETSASRMLQIGKSLFDEEGSKIVSKVMDKAKEKNVQIHLPMDVVTGSKFAEDATVGAATVESGIPGDAMVSSPVSSVTSQEIG